MFRRSRALARLDADIQDHLEREIQDNLDRGMTPEEARRRALITFGNVSLAKEDARAVWRWRFAEELSQDVRYALRTFRRQPGFAIVIVLTLALGIGANTAIFSLFEAIMLRGVALHEPEQLYFVAHGASGFSPSSNYPYYQRMSATTDVFDGVACYSRATFRVAAGDGVEMTQGQFVSGNYHAILGVPMAIGRGFTAEDDRGGPDMLIAVISDGYWTRKFGRDPNVLGQTLTIDGRVLSIVGVTAAGFGGLDPGTRVDVTLPLAVRTLDAPGFLTDHETWLGDMPIVARLRSGVEPARATAAIDAVFQQFLGEPPNVWLRKMPGWDTVRASLIPAGRGTAGLRDQYSVALNVLMVMVGLVLVIGCANVANLLLARATARAREVTIRLSIGAGRARLVRQFLTESMLLALIGGALGFALARFGTASVASLVEAGPSPILLDLQPNAAVLVFTIGLSALTGLLFGLAPAFGATRVDLTGGLKAGPVSQRHRRWSTRRILVAAQIALCVVLVAGAGLLTRTLRNLESRDGGFKRENLLLFSLDVRKTAFPVEQVPALCDQVIERLVSRTASIAGSCSRNIPVNTRGNAAPLEVPGSEPRSPNERFVFTNMISPDYFRTLGIGLVSGRVFDARDTAKNEKVAIINRSVARFFFGDADPIGRRVHFFRQEANPMTIVGLVEDTTQRSLRDDPPRIVYTPLSQLSEPEGLMTVALRTRQDPALLAAQVRAEVRGVNPNVTVDYIRTMEQQIGDVLVREQLLAMLSSAFSGLALLLSCIGLYGVVSYDVTRSLRDLGIRMALGAQRLDVLRRIIRGALSIASLGVVAGLLGAWAATRLLSTLLFGVTARDPLTLAGTALLLIAVTVIASYFPAHRAARIDPAVVLRTE
jgi:predicted permease